MLTRKVIVVPSMAAGLFTTGMCSAMAEKGTKRPPITVTQSGVREDGLYWIH